VTLTALDDVGQAALFTDARTANTFTSEPVTAAELDAIWELARWAPTSANTQPMRVLYLHPGPGRSRLLPHMNEGNRAKTATAPAVAVLAMDSRFHENIPAVLPELQDVFDANESLRTETARFGAALQAGYFILAVRSLGLAAGPMAGFNAEGVNAEFYPDGRFRSALIVNIGHPAKDAWRGRLPSLDSDLVVQHL
jgi:3-hydroxypropanoate dehydrogenase